MRADDRSDGRTASEPHHAAAQRTPCDIGRCRFQQPIVYVTPLQTWVSSIAGQATRLHVDVGRFDEAGRPQLADVLTRLASHIIRIVSRRNV